MTSEKAQLGILIPTINERITRMVRGLLPQLTRCHVTVSHQLSDGYTYEPSDELHVGNVNYHQLHSRGVSKNRNNCLSHMQEHVCLIVGDDVETVPDFERVILNEFKAHPEADLITFRVDRGEHHKSSYEDSFKHTKYTVRHSGYAIAFRPTSIKKADIRFDERFGLGAQYESGEDNIFLKDCFDRGLTLMHINTPVIRHTHLSSGWVWDTKQVKAKVAVFWRMYGGLIALGCIIVFTFNKHQLYKEHMTPLGFLGVALSTWFTILVRGL